MISAYIESHAGATECDLLVKYIYNYIYIDYIFLSPSLRPKSIHLTLGHHIVADIVLAIKFLEFVLQLALGPQAAEGWIYNSAKGQSKLFSTCLQRGGKSRAIEKKTSAGHHFLSRHRRSPAPKT